MGYSPWGRKESDTTEVLSTQHRAVTLVKAVRSAVDIDS